MSLKEQVPSRCYYYLLDFNDQDNRNIIESHFKTTKLHELSIRQFWELFALAVANDVERAPKQ